MRLLKFGIFLLLLLLVITVFPLVSDPPLWLLRYLYLPQPLHFTVQRLQLLKDQARKDELQAIRWDELKEFETFERFFKWKPTSRVSVVKVIQKNHQIKPVSVLGSSHFVGKKAILTQLYQLNLEGCGIKVRCKSCIFMGFDNILFNHSCFLQVVTSMRVLKMHRLKRFSLKNNQLAYLPEDLPYSLPALQELDLSYNRFKTIDISFSRRMALLHLLDISANDLQTLRGLKFAFEYRKSPLIVDVQRTNLTKLALPSHDSSKTMTVSRVVLHIGQGHTVICNRAYWLLKSSIDGSSCLPLHRTPVYTLTGP